MFVDYNQNARDRTIASAYSLRPIAGAPASTPLRWEELARSIRATSPFSPFRTGSLTSATSSRTSTTAHSLQPLLDLWQDDLARGLEDKPYPPDYPKMPGEPPRVQPSKKNPLNWEND